jgi:hypothetical protein
MGRLAGALVNAGTVGVFILVTVIIGGGAAFLTGRAIASTWRPWWQVAIYALVLAAVVRFFHMALFQGELLSLPLYLVDVLVCLVFGFWGYRTTRARQMAQQYGWLYRRAGFLGFARKQAPNAAEAEFR